jgi:Phosphotransferase enzyme family
MATSNRRGEDSLAAAQQQSLDKTRAIVECLLCRRFGGRVQLDAGEKLSGSPRSRVVRLGITEGPAEAPKSILIKQYLNLHDDTGNARDPYSPVWRFFNEWAGLKFLEQLSPGAAPAPRLYAGDREAGLLVLEDMGAGPRLDQVLAGQDRSAAEAMLLSYAQTLGTMHAISIGHKSDFEQLRREMGIDAIDPRGLFAQLIPAFCGLMTEAGLSTSSAAMQELAGLGERFASSGPFEAYVHQDPCPDNCLRSESGVKLCDFEYAGYGQALTDGVYGRTLFPSCWCAGRLPERVLLQMEEAYRAVLQSGCPEAADETEFGRALTDGCAIRVLASLANMAERFNQDSEWGTATFQQRILALLDVLTATTWKYNWLSALGDSASLVAATLRRHWPAEPLPCFPAFCAE